MIYNNQYITIGCGSSPAIYFEIDTFKNGNTFKCETFNSPQLTKTMDNQFEIHSIEVWGPQISTNK